MKKCTKCGKSYPESSFYKDNGKVSGYKSTCKICNRKKKVKKIETTPYEKMEGIDRHEYARAQAANWLYDQL
jgi:hypothetical protein